MSNNIPNNLKYAESHEWISVSGDIATVGITDHAQAELSDVVYVEPPKAGRKVKAKESVAVVESVKAASDIYSPVSGEVVEANAELTSAPDLVNKDPYGKAWLFKLRLSDPKELDALKDATAYASQIGA
jgi:glycine cleavage system H protein